MMYFFIERYLGLYLYSTNAEVTQIGKHGFGSSDTEDDTT